MSVFKDLESRERCYSSRNSVRRTVLGSVHFVEKFNRNAVLLEGHTGCVNSILFSECGTQIITGSDDLNINFYDLNGEMINHMATVHTNNIFFAKDLPVSSCNEIVSCAADGRVVLSNVVQSKHRQLFKHRGRAHRIALVPLCPTQFYSCGEDGICCLYDIRTSTGIGSTGSPETTGSDDSRSCVTSKIKFITENYRSGSIYCLGVNSSRPFEIALAGTSPVVSIYDIRKFQSPMFHLCPTHLCDTTQHVTGLRYDYTGGNIIASYNDDDIYRMSTIEHARPHSLEGRVIDQPLPPLHPPSIDYVLDEKTGGLFEGFNMRYKGHRNCDTVKQVSFLGSQSEMIASGSDCGHVFIWETNSGKLIKIFKGDAVGAINCLSGHPYLPYLATSGLDSVGKLWMPTGDRVQLNVSGSQESKDLERILEENSASRIRGAGGMAVPTEDFVRWMMTHIYPVEGGDPNLGDEHGNIGEIMARMFGQQAGDISESGDDEDDEDDYDDDDEDEEEDDDDDEDDEEDDWSHCYDEMRGSAGSDSADQETGDSSSKSAMESGDSSESDTHNSSKPVDTEDDNDGDKASESENHNTSNEADVRAQEDRVIEDSNSKKGSQKMKQEK